MITKLPKTKTIIDEGVTILDKQTYKTVVLGKGNKAFKTIDSMTTYYDATNKPDVVIIRKKTGLDTFDANVYKRIINNGKSLWRKLHV